MKRVEMTKSLSGLVTLSALVVEDGKRASMWRPSCFQAGAALGIGYGSTNTLSTAVTDEADALVPSGQPGTTPRLLGNGR
jgi:hypothetical protein